MAIRTSLKYKAVQNNWKKQGISRLISACHNSAKGLRSIWSSEAAFRQEVLLTVPMIVGAFFLGQSVVEIALLISVCVLVLLTEVINTAIEAVVDRISLEHSELSGFAKDLGSLAVLISLSLAGLVWGMVIFDRFIK